MNKTHHNRQTLFKSRKPGTETSSTPPLRISDVLLFEEDDEVLEESLIMKEDGRVSRGWVTSIHCYPPHRIFVRWLSSLKRARMKKHKEEEREVDGGDRMMQVKCSTKGLNGQDLVNSVSEESNTISGQCRNEASFNLGVGCCLLYLMAVSKSEIDKMMEMRMRMEMLLQNVREELQKKDALSKSSEMDDMFSHPIKDALACPYFENQNSPEILTPSYILPASSTVTVCDQSFRCETPKQECFEGMDKLEAELEVELERLQFHLDTVENSVKRPQQKCRLVINEDTATSKSQTLSSGEVVDPTFEPQAAGTEEHCGVPPHELERRLHELLESRQEEQIRELETTLECVKHKLRNKEMEVSWWKDTTRLVSRHLPESSRLSSHHRAKLLSP